MVFKKKAFIGIIILIIVSSLLITYNKYINKIESNDSNKLYKGLFKEDDIINVNVEISEDDWKSIKENAIDEKYHSINISINDNRIENVGIRTKGFSSLKAVSYSSSNRYSFRIKFDKYVDGQNFNGLDELVLNNNFQDPSYMREYLSYKILDKMGVDVPKTTYANLYINGELFGFYLAVEAIDESFIKRISNEDLKNIKLYKASEEGATLIDEHSLSSFELKIGENDDYKGLKKLIASINSIENGSKGDIESLFDVDTFLKSIAVNTVIGNYDSYNGPKAHNYFLMEENGFIKYIPWDFNMSFGGFIGDNGESISVSIDEPVYNISYSKRPLIKKLLSIGEYKERYYSYLIEIIKYYNNFEKQINELSNLIKSYVKNDPTAFYTMEQFEENIIYNNVNLINMKNNIYSKDEERDNISFKIHSPVDDESMNLNREVISIMDYLQQRIENIKKQLK